jgi:hypothetical protein
VSSRYEGLNLPQLLELVHELVVPEPVPWTPQTPGWWVLLGWLLAVSALVIAAIIRRRRRNRYRREALALLNAVAAQADIPPAESARRVAEIIKRTALVAYPRAQVANLYGSAWAQFLRESSGNDRRVSEAAQMLAAAAYRRDAAGEALVSPARRWIKVHRA